MSQQIRKMFAAIAKRYDLGNDTLSLFLHRLWRGSAIKFSEVDLQGKRVLDLCTGTGDFAFCLAKKGSADTQVVGVDFTPEMLGLALRRLSKKAREEAKRISFVQADALCLPFPDNSFDLATVAFGVRNLDNLLSGLTEIRRVLKKDGQVAILEFGQPSNRFFKKLYGYFCNIYLFTTDKRY